MENGNGQGWKENGRGSKGRIEKVRRGEAWNGI